MDGLNKIDLNLEKPVTSNDVVRISPANRNSFSRTKVNRRIDFKKLLKSRKMAVVLVIVVVLFLFSIFGIYLPATKVYKSVKVTYADAQAASYAIKTQNISLASDQLVKIKTDLTQTQTDLHAMAYL